MGYEYKYQPATKGKYWNLPDISISGIVIHSIGTPQPKAQPIVDYFNSSTATASIHGVVEPGLYIETAPTKISKRKAKKCYHCGSGNNGSWNNNRLGIEMTEPKTIKYIGGASFKDLDPEATKAHMIAVTATMAEVAADLCKFHGFTVDMISTHAEGYRLGFCSNHGDPEHLWKHIGYSLTQFRKDVQKIINNEKEGSFLDDMTEKEFEAILDKKFAEFDKKLTPTIYKELPDVPEWARPTVAAFMREGIIKGTGDEDKDGTPDINMSEDLARMLVILERIKNAGYFKD